MRSATKYFYKAACVERCPSRFYANSNTHVCSPCADPNAATCDAGGALSCESGYLSNRQCLPSCPSGTYAVNRTCKSCGDLFGVGTATCTSKNALTCARGYNLKGKDCISDAECSRLGEKGGLGFFPNRELRVSPMLWRKFWLKTRHDSQTECVSLVLRSSPTLRLAPRIAFSRGELAQSFDRYAIVRFRALITAPTVWKAVGSTRMANARQTVFGRRIL